MKIETVVCPGQVTCLMAHSFWVYLGVKTCEDFLCFVVAIVRVRSIMLTFLFSLFYVTGECHRFLHRGWALVFPTVQLAPSGRYNCTQVLLLLHDSETCSRDCTLIPPTVRLGNSSVVWLHTHFPDSTTRKRVVTLWLTTRSQPALFDGNFRRLCSSDCTTRESRQALYN